MDREDCLMTENAQHNDTIDYLSSELYLETLIGPMWATEVLVAQSYDDNRDRKKQAESIAKAVGQHRRDPYAKVHIGTWEKLKPTLTTFNKNGASVSLTINHTVGGRKVEHVQSIRAIWCEFDGPHPAPEWLVPPHITVESSPGKFHFYWLTDHSVTANDHARLMATMVGKWESDSSATDVVRVLRIPGFLHQKVDASKGLIGSPWQVRLRSAEARDALPLYTRDQLLQGFAVEEWETQRAYERPPPPPPHERTHYVTSLNVIEVKDALQFLNADDHHVRIRIGMALASTRHTSAFQIWDEWSRGNQNYDEEEQYRVWQGFREHKDPDNTNGHRVTLGSLYKAAKEAGWDRDAGWHKGLLTNQQGHPVACPANIALILRHTPLYKDHLRFDRFAGHIEYGSPAYDDYGRNITVHRWNDVDDALLAEYLRQEHHMAVTNLTHCTQAIEQVAHEAEYDPIVSWLDGLPAWDAIDRLHNFFEDYCDVPKSPYSQFCGHSLFLSLIARAYMPGCQVDTVLVLQGEEGVKKTSLCRLLGGPWYKAITLSFESKDLFQSLRRTWIGELAELDSFARSGQARIKALLSTMEDSYRPPYARHEIDQPRRSVFIGTTNDPAYLVDPHGARRFLPLEVGTINLSAIADQLPQLFAEARDRYKRGENWWQENAEVQMEASDKREIAREADPWETIITQFAVSHPGPVCMGDILGVTCVNIPTERQTRSQSTRAGLILHRMGYVKVRQRTPDDWEKRQYVYVKK